MLVIVTGNLALVAIEREPLVDVEAVAEWRLDPDALDEDPGAEPPMPALVGFFRDAIVFPVVVVAVPQYPQPIAEVRQCACATRAPPLALLA